MIKNNKILIRIDLVSYLAEEINKLPITAWEGKRTAGKAAELIARILDGKIVTPVRNCNSHNYPMHTPIKIVGSRITSGTSVNVRLVSMNRILVDDVQFYSLVEGGNSIFASDLTTETEMEVPKYIDTLSLLKEVVDSEIEIMRTVAEKDMDPNAVVLTSVVKLVEEPVSTLNMLLIKRAIEENREDTSKYLLRESIINSIRRGI